MSNFTIQVNLELNKLIRSHSFKFLKKLFSKTLFYFVLGNCTVQQLSLLGGTTSGGAAMC